METEIVNLPTVQSFIGQIAWINNGERRMTMSQQRRGEQSGKGMVEMERKVKLKVKVVLYSAIPIPSDCSKRFTLHPWQTCSFRHQLDFCFSGKHSSHAAIMRND